MDVSLSTLGPDVDRCDYLALLSGMSCSDCRCTGGCVSSTGDVVYVTAFPYG